MGGKASRPTTLPSRKIIDTVVVIPPQRDIPPPREFLKAMDEVSHGIREKQSENEVRLQLVSCAIQVHRVRCGLCLYVIVFFMIYYYVD